MPKLSVVIASTRPGRVGLPIGQWFLERAKAHGKFDVEVVDLKAQNLPPKSGLRPSELSLRASPVSPSANRPSDDGS